MPKSTSGDQLRVAGRAAPEGEIRLEVEGEDFATGDIVSKTVVLPLGPEGDGEARLIDNAGLGIRQEDGRVLIDQISFGSPAEQAKLDFDWEITAIVVPAERMPKQLFYLPAFILLALLFFLQRRRQTTVAVAEPAPN